MRTDGLDKPPPPQMYGSIWQVSSLSLAVTMKAPPGVNAGELLGREVRAINGGLPVFGGPRVRRRHRRAERDARAE